MARSASMTDLFGYSVAIFNYTALVRACNNEGILNTNIRSGTAQIVDVNGVMNMQDSEIVININYDYETKFELTGKESGNRETTFERNECNCNHYDTMLDIDSCDSPWVIDTVVFSGCNGCFDITYSDCDDSVANDRTENHGNYQVIVASDTAAFGGYYKDSETHVICTDKSHISFCIVTEFCQNKLDLWTNDKSGTSLNSYHSIVNSRIEFGDDNTSIVTTIYCAADHACVNSTFGQMHIQLDIRCSGIYSCSSYVWYWFQGYIDCFGIESCNDVYLVAPWRSITMNMYGLFLTLMSLLFALIFMHCIFSNLIVS